ncbi:integrase [Psychromonas sp. psych-6C06]|uniref:tyrosine-type recombinase/integrase n=1 Tax=Psychromonas sp. psych-6C06 TaxID=2058089 RepID=UPI000C323995|nr:site-specific integrase [Psychromonas sp. psych-6C06]PKF60652.1 integrase [Psychromonas sp. psych-6C06]
MALTDSKLRSIKAPYTGKPEVFDRDGLTIRVSKNAVIVFYFRFQWFGKPQRMKIGRYPEVKLAEAREQVIKLRRAVFDGDDPRHILKGGAEHELLGNIAQEFLTLRVDKELSKKSQALYHSTFNKYVVPNASINVERYSYTQWIAFFDRINKDSSPENAGNILSRFKTFVRWAKSRGRIKQSHLLDIPTLAVGNHQRKRERTLEWFEVAKLWREIEMSRAALSCRVCTQLLILTGARNSEIREAHLSEFDLGRSLWILPADRSKTKKAIRRALSDKVVELIKSLDLAYGHEREFLIPGQSAKKPLTSHAQNRFVQRLNDRMKLDHFVPHDFRRTIVTRLSENGVMPHVTEKMLGHELGGIMAIYNKHDWLDEQLAGYNLYWELLEKQLR